MFAALWFYLLSMCAARYREKDENDLAWNRIRRQVTRDIDTRIQNFREVIINDALSDAWHKYVKAMDKGTVVELEDEATRFVDEMIDRYLKPELTNDGDLATDRD